MFVIEQRISQQTKHQTSQYVIALSVYSNQEASLNKKYSESKTSLTHSEKTRKGSDRGTIAITKCLNDYSSAKIDE
jgi:hypothetical protein